MGKKEELHMMAARGLFPGDTGSTTKTSNSLTKP